MAVQKIAVRCVEIEDRPGSLHKLLAQLASAGVDLLCFTAFSAGTDHSYACLSGKEPAALDSALGQAGIEADSATGFLVSCDDRVGAGAAALAGLADAQINGRTAVAMVWSGNCQLLIVVDAADADAAEKALQGI